MRIRAGVDVPAGRQGRHHLVPPGAQQGNRVVPRAVVVLVGALGRLGGGAVEIIRIVRALPDPASAGKHKGTAGGVVRCGEVW